jgi:hypothetical protein
VDWHLHHWLSWVPSLQMQASGLLRLHNHKSTPDNKSLLSLSLSLSLSLTHTHTHTHTHIQRERGNELVLSLRMIVNIINFKELQNMKM